MPVVATRAAGPAALICDGKDGLLTAVDDSEALAKSVARLLADTTLRTAFAAAGRARVANEFSEAAIVAQWRTLFTRLGGASCAA